MKKLIHIIVLICVLVFGTCLCYAGNEEDLRIITVADEIANILFAIRPDAEDYGLGNCDWDSIRVSSKIPVYNVTGSIVETYQDVEYYLVEDTSGFVAVASVTYSADGARSITFGADFAEKLNDALGTVRTGFFFEKANRALYLAYNGKVTELDNAGLTTEEKEANDTLAEQQAETLELAFGKTISYTEVIIPQLRTTTVALNVSIQTMPSTSNRCWAYCLSSMCYFEDGVYYSPDYLTEQSGQYDMVNTATASTIYDYYCGITNTYGSGYLTISGTESLIDNGVPIYTGFGLVGTYYGHACVIRGYIIEANATYVSMMDPSYSYYRLATITSSGITYTSNSLNYSWVSWMHSI